MSDNETVKFVVRMALHNHSRIGNNIKLVLSKVGLSVNQIRDISSADDGDHHKNEGEGEGPRHPISQSFTCNFSKMNLSDIVAIDSAHREEGDIRNWLQFWQHLKFLL